MDARSAAVLSLTALVACPFPEPQRIEAEVTLDAEEVGVAVALRNWGYAESPDPVEAFAGLTALSSPEQLAAATPLDLSWARFSSYRLEEVQGQLHLHAAATLSRTHFDRCVEARCGADAKLPEPLQATCGFFWLKRCEGRYQLAPEPEYTPAAGQAQSWPLAARRIEVRLERTRALQEHAAPHARLVLEDPQAATRAVEWLGALGASFEAGDADAAAELAGAVDGFPPHLRSVLERQQRCARELALCQTLRAHDPRLLLGRECRGCYRLEPAKVAVPPHAPSPAVLRQLALLQGVGLSMEGERLRDEICLDLRVRLSQPARQLCRLLGAAATLEKP